jgi:hypothetical protein
MGLVLENPNDMFAAAEEVARDDDAWGTREIEVDGEVIDGYEREFGGRWVAYYLTPLLIVSVLAPAALRPDTVELIRLQPDELARMDTPYLSDLEEELLELCGESPRMGATTTTLHESVSGDYDRPVVEAALRCLVAQGFLATRRVSAGTQRSRDVRVGGDEDHWWVVTEEGRTAIGLPSRQE